MNKLKLEKVMIAMAATLAVVAFGCNDDDDDADPAGSVGVEVTGQQATPQTAGSLIDEGRVLVSLSYLALKQEGAADVVLVSTPSDLLDVTNGTVIDAFEVPAGEYHGVEVEVDDVQVKNDDGQGGEVTCPTTNIDGMLETAWSWQLPGGDPFLTVEENGDYSLLVELPVISGYCTGEGDEGQIQTPFDQALNVTLAR